MVVNFWAWPRPVPHSTLVYASRINALLTRKLLDFTLLIQIPNIIFGSCRGESPPSHPPSPPGDDLYRRSPPKNGKEEEKQEQVAAAKARNT
jgi:hypothetical protein